MGGDAGGLGKRPGEQHGCNQRCLRRRRGASRAGVTYGIPER